METETLEAMLTTSDSQILLFIITIVFGLVALKLFSKLLRRLLLISSLDNAVVHFCASSVQIVLGVLLVLFALSLIDIPLTSMIALISAFGVALGLALQDSIANVANGLIMIGTRPFKVGDYVRIGSDEGTIEELRLMDTVLRTENNHSERFRPALRSPYGAGLTAGPTPMRSSRSTGPCTTHTGRPAYVFRATGSP